MAGRAAWDLETLGYEARLIDADTQAVLATATVRVAERAFVVSSLLTEAGVISKVRVAELVAMLAARRDDSGVHPVTHVVFERLRDGVLVSKRYEIERLLRVIGKPPA